MWDDCAVKCNSAMLLWAKGLESYLDQQSSLLFVLGVTGRGNPMDKKEIQ